MVALLLALAGEERATEQLTTSRSARTAAAWSTAISSAPAKEGIAPRLRCWWGRLFALRHSPSRPRAF